MVKALFRTGIPDLETAERLSFQLSEHLWRNGQTVLVWLPDDASLQRADALMWGGGGFLPHAPLPPAADDRAADEGAADDRAAGRAQEPVLLSCESQIEPSRLSDRNALIVVAGPAPQYWSRYPRLYYLAVDDGGEMLRQGRADYAMLRDAGAPLEHSEVRL